MDETTDGGKELKEAIWKWSGLALVWLSLIATGVIFGWIWWGDAVELRAQNRDLQLALEKSRTESGSKDYRMNKLQEDIARMNRVLQEKGIAPPGTVSQPTTGAPGAPPPVAPPPS